jgi:hypothetical protein
MGGPGSGRRPWRVALEDCRCLEVGELCDAGRLKRQPAGEVVWYGEAGQERARLRYWLARHPDNGKLHLVLCDYGPRRQAFAIDVCPGLATCAICACGKAVRQLYAPPHQSLFACRHCWGLVYRKAGENASKEMGAWVCQASAPALDSFFALPRRVRRRPPRTYVEKPPATLAAELVDELPLAPQELRLWCLRLRAVGLSYRQIARLTASSKSTVARYCAEGRKGIDPLVLSGERQGRTYLPRLAEDAGLAELRSYPRANSSPIRTLGLAHRYWATRERRVVLPLGDSGFPKRRRCGVADALRRRA